MIRINLLPAEMRRGNRVAVKVLVAAFASALAVSASVGWFGIVWFGDLAAAENNLASVQGQLASKQQDVAYYTELEKNRKDYAQRVQTIQDIGKSRRLWSQFLDQLIDVVNNNGDTDRHLAWFDRMSVRTDKKGGATVTIPGQVQDADKARLSNFHEDLESAPFAAGMSKSEPSWRLNLSSERQPPESLKFPLTLELPPRGGKKK
ncbi:MAG: hypothetical protein NXI31_23655 [bacterium]|nr:hypothetical protein [bacterium]